MGIFSRAEQIFGQDGLKSLGEASVAVFGIGGVGGYVAEMLARSGVGHITLFDSVTLNRLRNSINHAFFIPCKICERIRDTVKKLTFLFLCEKYVLKVLRK